MPRMHLWTSRHRNGCSVTGGVLIEVTVWWNHSSSDIQERNWSWSIDLIPLVLFDINTNAGIYVINIWINLFTSAGWFLVKWDTCLYVLIESYKETLRPFLPQIKKWKQEGCFKVFRETEELEEVLLYKVCPLNKFNSKKNKSRNL